MPSHNKNAVATESNQRSEVLNTFCDYTTVHGVYQINRKQYTWILLLLSMLGLTIWSTTDNVMGYLTYYIATSTTTKQFSQTPFPSITFCERSPLIQSSLTNNNDAFFMLAAMYYSRNANDMKQIFTMLKDGCSSPSAYANSTNDDDESFQDFTGNNFQYFNEFSQTHVLDSFKSVKKCWWMNKDVKCNGLFFNRLLDTGSCFTFNPSTDWLKNGLQSVGYGFNLSEKDKVVTSFGPKTGIRLILFAGGKDNCAFTYWQGAGYQVKIHDPNDATPMFYLGKSISLEPGYEYSVQIMPTVNDKKTANLGKCLGFGYYRTTDGTEYYNQAICFMTCFLEQILQACHCKPWFVLGVEDQFSLGLGYSLNRFNSCASMPELSCVKAQSLRSIMSDVPQEVSCPHCLPACQEITYDYLVTRKRFPANKHFAKVLLLSMNSTISIEYFRKHYLSVNFFVDKLLFQEVTQFQARTIIDVAIYFGGVIGLFMGMSFLSIFEIFQVGIDLFDIFLRSKFWNIFQSNSRQSNKIRPIKILHKNTVHVGGMVNRRHR